MPTENQAMVSPCFTLEYAAPEVLKQALPSPNGGYSEACDLWSLGVVMVSRVLVDVILNRTGLVYKISMLYVLIYENDMFDFFKDLLLFLHLVYSFNCETLSCF